MCPIYANLLLIVPIECALLGKRPREVLSFARNRFYLLLADGSNGVPLPAQVLVVHASPWLVWLALGAWVADARGVRATMDARSRACGC